MNSTPPQGKVSAAEALAYLRRPKSMQELDEEKEGELAYNYSYKDAMNLFDQIEREKAEDRENWKNSQKRKEMIAASTGEPIPSNPKGSFKMGGTSYQIVDGEWKALKPDGTPMTPGEMHRHTSQLHGK